MRRRWITLLAMLIAMTFLATAVCTALPTEGEGVQLSFAYGIEGRENNTELDAAELYELLFGEAPTAAEEVYLNARGVTLRYNDAISAGCISTDYRADTGVLSLTVRPYQCTAENGTSVLWLPTGATVDGQQITLRASDGVYTARMEGLFRTENFEMTVDYAWSAEIPADALEEIRNGAYRIGLAALKEQREYEAAYAEYERLSADYLAWQDYLERKLAYDAYVEALAAYEAQVKAYGAYVEAKAIYDVEIVAYEKWQDYYKDLAVYTEAYKKYTAYQSYLSAMTVAERKIQLMESIFISDSHSWRLYSSIMGSTVSRVIENKDELVNVLHCDERDVDLAKASTEALRPLLKGYNDIRAGAFDSSYEKTRAKYEYFVKNYDGLLLHFTNLYKTLDKLFENTFVQRAAEAEGQREHYLQFVGQLYVIATCLDTEGKRDGNWTIGGKRLEEVVEECQRLPDGDWDPRASAFPVLAEPAECPTPLTPPTEEMPARRPTPPTPVEAPPSTPPSPVENPDDGEIPPRCDEAPAKEPIAPVFGENEQALMAEVKAGTLIARAEEKNARTLSFSSRLSRPVSILNEKLVSFYNIDGTLLNRVLVSYGGALSYAPPEHAPSPEYEYRLIGWIGAEGNEVDLRFITTDLDLYPNYEITKKSYTVIWRVIGADGVAKEFSSVWTYGALPAPGAQVPCVSYEENGYVYTFSGWDKEILPVTGDVTYTGSVTRTPQKYTVTWVLGERTVTDVLSYGEMPVFTGDTSMTSPNGSYTFLGWSPAIGVVEGDATYVAHYEMTPFATSGSVALEIEEGASRDTVLAGGHASVSVREMLRRARSSGKELSVRWANGCEVIFDRACVEALMSSDLTIVVMQEFASETGTDLEFHFYNSLLKDAYVHHTSPTLYLPFAEEADGRCAAFHLIDGEETTRIETEYFPVKDGVTVRRTYVYPLLVTPDANCNTGALGYDAVPGTRLSLCLPCLFGYEVTGATVTDAEGNALPLDGLSFTMPASAVRVTLSVEKIRYRVVFRCEGVVLSDTEYAYGDEIVLPPTPQKPDEGDTVYTFVSWGSEVPTHATGEVREMIFDAVFSAQVKDIDYDTGHNNNLLAEVILPVIGAVLLVIGGVIAVIVTVRRRRR